METETRNSMYYNYIVTVFIYINCCNIIVTVLWCEPYSRKLVGNTKTNWSFNVPSDIQQKSEI